MNYLLYLFLLGLVVSLVAVASNPAPYFAALGLVMAAGVGCGILVGHGGSFLSLVLFLIYLGGMLVVFAYSAALAAEPYPKSWGDQSVIGYFLMYLLGVGGAGLYFYKEWYGFWFISDEKDFYVSRAEIIGVALLYSEGGLMLVVGGLGLLLTLFAVLELTRGLSRGALRAV
uniref:NADH-ubiquinone oxidoreductase chain 6 n=1 Tax=Hyphessobrycon herbertaxelrodi TaxID=681895 RepID=A0A7H1KFI3_9TELE|nr:NADH dehydrogenase subunit 6 [Hyphessobrycon herbertaxelrodi]QNT25992.1 NADH dehydrogenase subunit 6 [Hyphessobrycon herbertaxelrodi]QOW38141.1 NADH dehydrogenase subunit 6 [Hyphessobrycon herbertaxelrodi]